MVRPQAFAYNPMRLNIGSIAISSFDDDILVSPDYVVFESDATKLLPGCLNHLRRTRFWASHFEAAGSGVRIPHLLRRPRRLRLPASAID
ncbi:MAG: hypothetical protein IPK39_05155 [Sulfuritalea sp.]|nr:hypothetical protein [Sulfuritalea sp.]